MTVHIRKIILLITALFLASMYYAQEDRVVKAVQLKEFVISADDDLDVESFMTHVMTDSSFYQAFINLKYLPHRFNSELEVMNRKGGEKGRMYRDALQRLVDGKRVVEIREENTNGKLYKRNGEHRYLTAQMYDEVFYPEVAEPVSPHIHRMKQEEVSGSKLDKYKSQLKKMLFNPGQEIVSVPFIGDRMDIFAEDMWEYYDYSIYSDYGPDSAYCHVFLVESKAGFRAGKTVIKRMKTYFDKESRQVLSREYRLSNDNIFFEFDIWMKVENEVQDGLLLPQRIQYDGQWDIPFKSAEIIRFDIDCSDYDLSPLR